MAPVFVGADGPVSTTTTTTNFWERVPCQNDFFFGCVGGNGSSWGVGEKDGSVRFLMGFLGSNGANESLEKFFKGLEGSV